MKVLNFILALVAILFGLVTIWVGSSVFMGVNPGYFVYQPLLIFNTLMGGLYLLTGGIALFSVKKSVQLAAITFALNLIALATVFYLFKESNEIAAQGLEPENKIAIESLAAMTFRTLVWLILLIGFGWVNSKQTLKLLAKDNTD